MRTYILAFVVILVGYPAFGEDDRITDFNFETGGVHPYSRFTIDFFHDRVTESPANVEMNNWRNRGIQFSLVWPFRSRGPGISPAAGVSWGNNKYYRNDVFEWAFDEDGNIPGANIIPDTSGTHRTRLSLHYIEVPLELQYITSEVRTKQFIITLGVRSGLLINARTRYKSEDHRLDLRTRNNFRPYRLAGYARIGYKRFRVFGQYSFFGIFNQVDAPETQQYSIGVSVMLW